MLTFDHLKLVRRQPREVRKFRKWIAGTGAGELAEANILHEDNRRCCRREPWNQTAARIIAALRLPTPRVLVNLNRPEDKP